MGSKKNAPCFIIGNLAASSQFFLQQFLYFTFKTGYAIRLRQLFQPLYLLIHNCSSLQLLCVYIVFEHSLAKILPSRSFRQENSFA